MPIDTLVLHYTGMRSAADAIERLRDPAAKVSSHYVVEEDGQVWQLVPEERRAYHAGISHWRGHTALNDRSVGIEIVNPGHEWGYRPFPMLQMAALCELCLGVIAAHPIDPRNVVAHSDIAPDRKQDPGELFDWRGLAANGVGLWPPNGVGLWPPNSDGLWPPNVTTDDVAMLEALRTIGYRTDLPLPVLLMAFQRRWRPAAVTGEADAGTRTRLAEICAGYR